MSGTSIRVLVRNLRAQSEIVYHEIDQRVSVQSEPSVCVWGGGANIFHIKGRGQIFYVGGAEQFSNFMQKTFDIFRTHLPAESVFEVEVEKRSWSLGANSSLQV